MPAARLEFPTVVATGDVVAVEPPIAEGNATVWTAVAHGKDATIVASAENQRDIEEHGRRQLTAAKFVGPESRIPVVVQEGGSGALDGRARFGSCYEGHLEITIALWAMGTPTPVAQFV